MLGRVAIPNRVRRSHPSLAITVDGGFAA